MRLALAQLMVAIAAPLVLSAQNQAPRHGQAPDEGRTATVTGCLGRGVEPKTFVLNNVAWHPPNASPKRAHDSQPPPSAASMSATNETLRLGGAASSLGLDAYVGHVISATGALAKTDPPVTPGIVLPEPQGDTTSRTRAAEDQAAATLRTFDMRSMTDVAPQCR